MRWFGQLWASPLTMIGLLLALIGGLTALCAGLDAYRDNPFEVAARAAEQHDQL